ncbi:Centrosomal protein of 44 kDa, partial [Blyttiomyces sp. JEL0837]
MESVYKLLRDEFNYRPSISRDQFFSAGFAERKLIFVCDLIRLCRQMKDDLVRLQSQQSGIVVPGGDHVGQTNLTPHNKENIAKAGQLGSLSAPMTPLDPRKLNSANKAFKPSISNLQPQQQSTGKTVIRATPGATCGIIVGKGPITTTTTATTASTMPSLDSHTQGIFSYRPGPTTGIGSAPLHHHSLPIPMPRTNPHYHHQPRLYEILHQMDQDTFDSGNGDGATPPFKPFGGGNSIDERHMQHAHFSAIGGGTVGTTAASRNFSMAGAAGGGGDAFPGGGLSVSQHYLEGDHDDDTHGHGHGGHGGHGGLLRSRHVATSAWSRNVAMASDGIEFGRSNLHTIGSSGIGSGIPVRSVIGMDGFGISSGGGGDGDGGGNNGIENEGQPKSSSLFMHDEELEDAVYSEPPSGMPELVLRHPHHPHPYPHPFVEHLAGGRDGARGWDPAVTTRGVGGATTGTSMAQMEFGEIHQPGGTVNPTRMPSHGDYHREIGFDDSVVLVDSNAKREESRVIDGDNNNNDSMEADRQQQQSFQQSILKSRGEAGFGVGSGVVGGSEQTGPGVYRHRQYQQQQPLAGSAAFGKAAGKDIVPAGTPGSPKRFRIVEPSPDSGKDEGREEARDRTGTSLGRRSATPTQGGRGADGFYVTRAEAVRRKWESPSMSGGGAIEQISPGRISPLREGGGGKKQGRGASSPLQFPL